MSDPAHTMHSDAAHAAQLQVPQPPQAAQKDAATPGGKGRPGSSSGVGAPHVASMAFLDQLAGRKGGAKGGAKGGRKGSAKGFANGGAKCGSKGAKVGAVAASASATTSGAVAVTPTAVAEHSREAPASP